MGTCSEFPLRFPGQYADKEETNLFYNYFRDYDSAIGRYIQADLLGIAPAWPAVGLEPNVRLRRRQSS